MKPYDWEGDPECSWLRHPAGPGRRVGAGRRVEDMTVPPVWWWVALGVALGASLMALVFFTGN